MVPTRPAHGRDAAPVWYARPVPRFEPFRGLCYDQAELSRGSSDLSDVVAPPYDVIDAVTRATLARRSPYNSVLVELPEPDLEGRLDRYQHAASLIESWTAGGLLRLDERPCFYSYRMTFEETGGRRRRTTGMIGALEVSVPGESDVLPHERTMPKPKGDRLDLLRACRANLSPVWGLFLGRGLSDACSIERPADETAADDEGVVHELWRVEGAACQEKIASTVSAAPVVIADGHHRYETALAYRDECRRARGGAAGGYDLVMALVVELAEDQLTVRPIHRLLTGIMDDGRLIEALRDWFEVGDPDERQDGRALARMPTPGAMALVTREGFRSLHPRDRATGSPLDELDSTVLEKALGGLGDVDVSYEADVEEVMRAVESGRAQAAVLIRPATVAQIAACADARLLMPPKTTFFQPKPRTGMVFRPLAV